jgi:parvulin-like peptidyl-prolyl isomerase
MSEARARGDIETFRLTLEESRIRARVSSGTLTSDAGSAALQLLNDRGTNLNTQITSDMVDSLLIKELAVSKGVTLDQAAADAAWAKEMETPELRLLRRISITITNAPGALAPDATTEAAAQAKADAILVRLRNGEDFAAIAKAESSDSFAVEGGRIGWSSQADDPMSDAAYTAAWAMSEPGVTDVIKQASDQFVIFKVEQIRPAAQDVGFDQLASDAKIDLGVYKKMISETALADALNQVVTAELLVSPVEQRDISYVTITLPTDGSNINDEEVLVRHILYSPNNDSKKAAKLNPDDPAWAAAEAEANAAFAKIQAGTPMADLASESDDTGSGKNGGLLGWAPKEAYVPEFEAAVWADGLTVGDLLGPVKTKFGYHVIQFEGRRAGLALRMELLAKDLSTAGDGYDARVAQAKLETSGLQSGDAGFVSRYSINKDLSDPAWSIGVGEVTPVITLSDRLLIVRIKAAEQRALTPEQVTAIKGNGFYVWLDHYRSSAAIKIQGQVAQEAGATPTP